MLRGMAHCSLLMFRQALTNRISPTSDLLDALLRCTFGGTGSSGLLLQGRHWRRWCWLWSIHLVTSCKKRFAIREKTLCFVSKSRSGFTRATINALTLCRWGRRDWC